MKETPAGFEASLDDFHHSFGLTPWQSFAVPASFTVFTDAGTPYRFLAKEVVMDVERDQLVFFHQVNEFSYKLTALPFHLVERVVVRANPTSNRTESEVLYEKDRDGSRFTSSPKTSAA